VTRPRIYAVRASSSKTDRKRSFQITQRSARVEFYCHLKLQLLAKDQRTQIPSPVLRVLKLRKFPIYLIYTVPVNGNSKVTPVSINTIANK
jgi:hypothetical protein